MSSALDEQYSKLSVRELIASLPTAMLAKMAAERFDVFSALVMPDAFSTAPAEFHKYLTDVVSHNQRTGRREAVVGPRGWGKSTTITEGGVLWIICRNRFLELQKQYRFVLIVSDTTTQAEARLAVIKDNLMTNPAIERFFPEVFGQGVMWRQEKIVTRGDTCIATAGMNTSIRGARYKTRRPDLIIGDDVDSIDTAKSGTLSVDLQDRFDRDLIPAGHKETDILVVGTVLSKMCLVYKILNTDHYATWNSRLFKAMEHFPTHMKFWDTWGSMLKDKSLGKSRFEQAEAYYQTNKAVMDIGGVTNWPARYSVKELMYMFYAGGRKAFLTEQQNQIVDSGSTHFQVERYKLVGEPNFSAMLAENNPLYYAYIDPSGGASASSKTALATRGPDKFSIAVIAKFGPRFFMLAESVGKQLRQSSQFEEVAKVLTRYNIYKLTVENNAGQVHYVTALNQFLAQKFADPEWVSTSSTPYLIQARGVNNSVPKNDRISMLEPHLDNGTLHLPADIHSKHRDLADEFDEWPASQFDDCLDAVSGCFFSAFRTFQLRYLSD